MQQSIRGKILLITLFVLSVQAALIYLGDQLSWPLTLTVIAALFISTLILILLLRLFYAPIEELIEALETGVSSFKDKDFSIRIHKSRNDELGTIVDAYNDMANTLCEERMSLFQRELLLDTIIQSTPVSILLVDNREFVIYANSMAQSLFRQKKKLEGKNFKDLIEYLPADLKDSTQAMQNGLINLSVDHERISYYLHCQSFDLNSRTHRLYLYKNLTTEISRQEIDLWKNAIRLISHELNNSLAPITSMANSAKKILAGQGDMDMLPELIETIQLRTKRLKDFLVEYANFARLPAPKKETINLQVFMKHITTLCPFTLVSEIPDRDISLDPGQMEQVLINLYKNACEAGSETQDVSLSAELVEQKLLLTIRDRGPGMTEHQLQKALLPFFSTKPNGSGLGLSLCNEIVTAHEGHIRLQNREDKGLVIRITLPVSRLD